MNRYHEDLAKAVSTLARTPGMAVAGATGASVAARIASASVAEAAAAFEAVAASTTFAAHQLGEWEATAHSAGDGGPAIITDADRARRRARAKRERAARRSNRR